MHLIFFVEPLLFFWLEKVHSLKTKARRQQDRRTSKHVNNREASSDVSDPKKKEKDSDVKIGKLSNN